LRRRAGDTTNRYKTQKTYTTPGTRWKEKAKPLKAGGNLLRVNGGGKEKKPECVTDAKGQERGPGEGDHARFQSFLREGPDPFPEAKKTYLMEPKLLLGFGLPDGNENAGFCRNGRTTARAALQGNSVQGAKHPPWGPNVNTGGKNLVLSTRKRGWGTETDRG